MTENEYLVKKEEFNSEMEKGVIYKKDDIGMKNKYFYEGVSRGYLSGELLINICQLIFEDGYDKSLHYTLSDSTFEEHFVVVSEEETAGVKNG